MQSNKQLLVAGFRTITVSYKMFWFCGQPHYTLFFAAKHGSVQSWLFQV